MYKTLIGVFVLFVFLGGGCLPTNEPVIGEVDFELKTEEEEVEDVLSDETFDEDKDLTIEDYSMNTVRIKTEKGDIVIELYGKTAPKTVENFVTLAKKGFYDGLIFHRREEGFVIQGGDPNGNGTGGPGYKFEDELNDQYTYEKGIVAMANSGPNTNGSQFFIMLDDVVQLPKLYSIFGRVVEGMEVVDAIAIGDKMTTVTVETTEEIK